MPVAMITRSAVSGAPFLKESFRLPPACSILVTVAPVRTATPWSSSHRCTMPAQASSTMRGRMRGATSTIVSLAPRARIAFRIVKAMKPAPDHDHAATRRDAGRPRPWPRRASRSSGPGPVGAGDGRLGGPRAGGDQAVVELDLGAVVEGEGPGAGSRALAFRPTRALTFQAVSEAGVRSIHMALGDGLPEVVRQDHPRIRALRRDQGDLGGVHAAPLFFSDSPDRVQPRGAAADDQVTGRHQRGLHREDRARVRSAAKSPIQSRGLHVLEGDRLGRAGGGAGGRAAAEVALVGLLGIAVVEHGAVGARDRTELAPDAGVVDHVLGARRVDLDRPHRAGGHAPALRALGARVRRVGGVALEGRDADHRLGRLEEAGLHVGAGQLAPEAAGALLGVEREDFHGRRRFPFRPGAERLRSRRLMKVSSGMAGMVIICTEPRAPISMEMDETVSLSGASRIVTKS